MLRIISLISSSIFIFLIRLLPLKNRIIITSTGNVSYNFNSSPLFEFLKEKKILNWEVAYVINNPKKNKKLNKNLPEHTKFINTNNFIDFLYAARSKIWVSSSLNTPLTSFIYDKRRIVLHLGHGVPLKKIGLAEKNITCLKWLNRVILTKAFTDIICYSDFFEPIFEDTFNNKNIRFHYLGQPRNDFLNHNVDAEKERNELISEFTANNSPRKVLLYAPTWRPYTETIIFPFLSNTDLQTFLKEKNIVIFVRSHPFYPAKLNDDIQYSENIIDLDAKKLPDINKKLCAFDALITDYSSIYFDFLCLKKPIYFIPYDLEEYHKKVGFNFNYELFTPGDKINNCDDFFKALTIDEDKYSIQRDNILTLTNTKASGNCNEIYDLLYKMAISMDNRY
ncbi:CDP-glycerol glycerophosphotransferase family protein [Providencia rettgeri]